MRYWGGTSHPDLCDERDLKKDRVSDMELRDSQMK